MPRKPMGCEHGCGEPIIVKSTVGDSKLLILEDKMQKKLSDALVSERTVGGIEEGTVYEAGTSLEQILRDLLSGSAPVANFDIYTGGLDLLPESVADLELLTKETYSAAEMAAGISKHIAADEQYVTIAYKAEAGNIVSITEDGFEAISDFSNIFTFGEYKFYCTADQVDDPDGDINYVIKWGTN